MLIGIVDCVSTERSERYKQIILDTFTDISFKHHTLPYVSVDENTKLHILYFRLIEKYNKYVPFKDLEYNIDDLIDNYDEDDNDEIYIMRRNKLHDIIDNCHKKHIIISNLTTFESNVIEAFTNKCIIIYLCYDTLGNIVIRLNTGKYGDFHNTLRDIKGCVYHDILVDEI